uniref:Rab_C09 protein n=1 Tax=Paramecium tetraurelia TaxID=5888 RepID=Q3SDN8_PARTE|nr:rab_C09 [Paramecium tetraurelia]
MRNSDDYDYQYKIVIIGDSGVGKTNIMTQFTRGEFSEETKTTVGVEFANKQLVIDDKIIKAQLWDTAGQERYRAIISSYYKGASGALIVFDITKQSTFDNVDRWMKVQESTSNEISIILVGNKSDLRHLRQVSSDVSSAYASKHKIAFLETSAKDGANVNEAFNKLINGKALILNVEIHSKNKNNSIYTQKKTNQQITEAVQIDSQKDSGCC